MNCSDNIIFYSVIISVKLILVLIVRNTETRITNNDDDDDDAVWVPEGNMKCVLSAAMVMGPYIGYG